MEGPKSRGKSYNPLDMISADEEPNSAQLDKLPSLRAAFQKDGTVTAGHSSLINDGAVAMLIMDETQAVVMSLTSLAHIRGYTNVERPLVQFTTSPSNAAPIA